MPTNAPVTDGKFLVTHQISEAGTYSILFDTENQFVEHKIAVSITTPGISTGTLAITDKTTSSVITPGEPSNGLYPLTTSLTGTFSPPSGGGWISTGISATDNSVKVGYITQSTLQNGSTAINSGSTITPGDSAQTITISAGYNTARTLVIAAASSSTKGTIKSGGISSLTTPSYSYDSATQKFTLASTATISAPTVSSAGYVSSDADPTIGGTKQTNTSAVNITINTVTVGAEVDGSAYTRPTPVISRTPAVSSDTWVDAASDAASTTPAAGLPYVRVDTAAISKTFKVKGKVTGAGYGTTSNYNTAASLSTEVGPLAATTKYIPITVGAITLPTNVAPTIGSPAYQSSGTNSGKFTISITGAITIDRSNDISEGYLSSTIGTITNGSISGTAVLNKVKVGVTAGSTNLTVTPTIVRTAKPSGDTWTDAASGAATGDKPSSGVYVQVNADAVAGSTTVQGKVSSAGYGGTSSSQYNKDSATTITAGSAAAATKYIPIKSASNYSASIGTVSGSSLSVGSLNTSNNTYPVTSNLSIPATITAGTDGWFHSGTATGTKNSASVGSIPKATFGIGTNPNEIKVTSAGYITNNTVVGSIDRGTMSAVTSEPNESGVTYDTPSITIASGGWLKLTAGYYNATKISLATLVPNEADIPYSEESPYILDGHTAYDINGVLITGGIPTYGGAYTDSSATA